MCQIQIQQSVSEYNSHEPVTNRQNATINSNGGTGREVQHKVQLVSLRSKQACWYPFTKYS